MAFQCHVCGKEYNNKFNFNYHVAHHFDARPFICQFPGCTNSYKTKADLSQHNKSHEKALGLKFQCQECNVFFDSSTKLNVHKREQHSSKGGFWCELCNRNFANLRSHHLIVHTRIRPFVCDLDGKRFAKMHGLNRHIEAVHLGLTPFPCTQCKKKFKEASGLKKHMEHHVRILQAYKKVRKIQPMPENCSDDEEIETKKIRYKCGSCSQSFLSKSSLMKHGQVRHPDAKFICDACAQCFETKRKIACHIKKCHHMNHSGELLVTTKIFKCGACKKILSTKTGLDRHKRIVHLGMYDFMCEQCSAVFRDRGELNKHLAKYHNYVIKKESYICGLCNRKLLTPHALVSHELACRLKKQNILNRELDGKANIFMATKMSQKASEPITTSLDEAPIEVEDLVIKEEPIEYLEQFQASAGRYVKQELLEEDPFDNFQAIKNEGDDMKAEETFSTTINSSIEITDVDVKHELNNVVIEITIKGEPSEVEPLEQMTLITKIKCNSCSERFDTREAFLKHFELWHSGNSKTEIESDSKCDDERNRRKRKTTCDWKMSQPMKTPKLPSKLDEILKCKTCSKVFKTEETLKRHIKLEHTVKSEKGFGADGLLQGHYQRDCHSDQKCDEGTNRKQPEEEETDGEQENIDETVLSQMFKGETFNVFGRAFECKICSNDFEKLAQLKLHCVNLHRIKKFKCVHCYRSFGYKSSIHAHWARNHKKTLFAESFLYRNFAVPNESFACPHCDKVLSQKESLKRHIAGVHDEERPMLYCDQCGESFKDQRTLKYHNTKYHSLQPQAEAIIRRRKTTKAIPCDQCNELVYGKVALQTHWWNKHLNIKIVGKTRFHCLICQEVMQSRASAQRHHVQVHHEGKVLMRTCRVCDIDFQLFDDFKMHIDEDHIHENLCLVCGIKLNLTELANHAQSHRSVPESEKNKICDLCGFKAQQKVSIAAHMVREHGADKKEYSTTCEFCGASFTCYQSFNTHRRLHLDKDEKTKCRYCDKVYSYIKDLRSHEATHTHPGEKAYRCEYTGCTRQYSSYSSYRWHIRYSHEENRKQCKVCLEVLTSRERLIAHTEANHPELRRYSCRCCGKSFASQTANMKHMMNCEPTTVM